jgi:UDP-4-amino-4,6-dideoxy-N-acetyl-beta-L-altrosamine transaminase
MSKSIPYGRQSISNDDINEVRDVLNSDFLTQGPRVPIFENNVAEYCNAKYAVATNSATSSLHSACVALGVSANDIVWTSANTFVASSNCALYCGANVDFVDIDLNTFNMCPIKLEEKLIVAKKMNKLPKVVIPVHMCGQSCDMKKIYMLSKNFGFKIIEDASHGIGGSYNGFKIGSCKYSDITVFSFHPVKIITSGEGGMSLTNNKKLANKLQMHRTHGITRNPEMLKNKDQGLWYYEELELGFNYRMTEISAALGNSQLNRLDSFVEKRHEIAKKYDQNLSDLPLDLPFQLTNNYSSYHLYVIRLQIENIEITHQDFFKNMRSEGIGVNLHYIPVYKHPYYKSLGFKDYICKNAEQYYKTAVSIPIYPELSIPEQDYVIEKISDNLARRN